MAARDKRYVEGIGRRKMATARVRIVSGEGTMLVNGKPVDEYFPNRFAKFEYLQPFEVTKTVGKFDVQAHVVGSGSSAQLGAFVHGLARALQKQNIDFRSSLKRAGLLTRDSRMKESKKAGRPKSRKGRQSPKR